VNARDWFEGIRDGGRRPGRIRCRRLLRLDSDYAVEVRREVERLCRHSRPSQATDPRHPTYWTRPVGEALQWSLLNASGRTDDCSLDHDLSCLGKRFHQASEHPALACLIAAFPHAINFRINMLGPHSGLSPHQEHVVFRTRGGTVGARVRLHLPVVTQPGAELMLDGLVYYLEPNTIHFVNHGCVHSASNRAAVPRTHLVFDVLLTRDSFGRLFDSASRAGIPAVRVDDADAELVALRGERVGPYRRLPSPIPLDETQALEFCEVQ
jgi:hypothetical protein